MNAVRIDAVRRHYDKLSTFYLWLWGEHIHHGFWRNGESPAEAQSNLICELARRTAMQRGATVLDVGCGIGGTALWLAREFDCSVFGITISPVQKKIAEQRAKQFGLSDRARFAVADANHLHFGGGTFDVVWNIECSEHLSDKARFIADSARLLRPGGRLGLCAWLGAEPSSASQDSELLGEICAAMLCPALATASEYKEWMRSSGLVEIEAEDLTARVAKTWDVCAQIMQRPSVRLCLPFLGNGTRQFTDAFDAIRRAYRNGAMCYGMFTATKP